MASFWSQLKVLLWRNFLLKKRNKKQLIKEILYPILLVLVLAAIKKLIQPKTNPAIPNFPSYSLSNKYHIDGNKRVLVTPNTTAVRDIMKDLQQYVGNNLEYFADSAAAEISYKLNPDNVSTGVIFYSTGENPSYAIRISYDDAASTTVLFENPGQCRDSDHGSNSWGCDANTYLVTGYSWFQNALDTVLIKKKSPNFALPDVFVNMMPKGEYTENLVYIQMISSVYFVLAFSFFINFLAVNLVAEKENKIREAMKMMGLRNSVFWASWGLTYALILAMITAIFTLLLFALTFFSGSSNLFIFYLLMFLYGLSIISLSFLVTPFFDKAQVAGGVTGVATVIISCLYFALSTTRELTPQGYHYSIPPGGIWALCLLSPVALALGIDQGIYLDTTMGMTFDHVSEGEFPLYGPMIMLVVDCVLYAVLAVYFDHVIPSEYGPRYPPWFFLMPSYYRQRTDNKDLGKLSVGSRLDVISVSSPDLESVGAELKDKAVLRIYNISKDFKSDDKTVHAVEGFSLDMYEGHITALLGHNGAGKTTLMNMLCGLSPPTSGTATIYGMDVSVSGDMERIRSMCGVCPQHNILYDDLTTIEHLKVFAGIKGIPANQREAAVTRAMKDVDITDKADTFAKNLSGGQKRKLSVAMALIGDPKIIFLDEPTAGMDPYSRRHLWSLLQKSKHDRIILLTTHFMDEADILADRKAIISHGKLRCCGSSLFLKNRFGIGYHLNMMVEPSCDSSKVNTLLMKHVQGIEMKRSHAKELAFTMPLSEVSSFSNMFTSLEQTVDGQTRAEILGIRSYGVSMTTLEEVFLKIGEEEEELEETVQSFENPSFKYGSFSEGTQKQLPSVINKSSVNTDSEMSINMTQTETDPVNGLENKPTVVNLTSQRFWTLLKIRFLIHRRNALAVFFQVVLPVTLVIVGCVIHKLRVKSTDADNPVQVSFQNMSSKYVASHHIQQISSQNSPPLLVMDSQGNSASEKFVAELNQTWEITQLNLSFNLMNLPGQHFLGVNLHSWQDTPNYRINYTMLYNDTAIHSVPVMINLMSNAIYSTITNNNSMYINSSSLPWPSKKKYLDLGISGFFASLILSLAFILISPGFSVHMVRDRMGKFRGQLRVAGINFNLYWGSIFTLNIVTYVIPAVLCLFIVGVAKLPSLDQTGALVALGLMFITFMPAMILFAYVFSFAFDKFETCQAVLPMLIMIVSIIPYVVVATIDTLGSEQVARMIHYIITIIDLPYTLAGGLFYINRIYLRSTNEYGGHIPIEKYFEPENNVLISILMPLFHIVWLYILLRIFDVRSTGGKAKDAVKCGKESKVQDVPEDNQDLIQDEDEDVTEERDRVNSLDRHTGGKGSVAYVKNLRREFRKDNTSCYRRDPKKDSVKVAVRNATFAVDSGEVFGLLGPNGAGKTTLLNMIIAETGQTRGKVMVAGHNVHSSMLDAFQAMGYCPQHDALWDVITLREHIELYGLMHGLTESNSAAVANGLIKSLQIEEHADKWAVKLSGGTRRKLSYAISMLGSPEIVLLDEPSTGMDPKTKRFLWDTISSSFEGSSRGAILTTHYMEEADALCSRVAIMVNGKIECLGPTQHLKDKYGSGYLLEVKLKLNASHNMEEKMDSLERHLVSLFPHATCVERFEERGQYKMPKQDVTSLAETFSRLEETKQTHDVEEYSFSQSTLEQVFLDFAKKQHEGEDVTDDDPQRNMARQLSGEPDVTQVIPNSTS